MAQTVTKFAFPNEVTTEVEQCIVCGATTTFCCSRCRRVYYCSQSCQRLDWRSHKLTCSETTATPPPVSLPPQSALPAPKITLEAQVSMYERATQTFQKSLLARFGSIIGAYEWFDTNTSGFLDIHEFERTLIAGGVNNTSIIKEMFSALDRSGSGRISISTFLAESVKKLNVQPLEEMHPPKPPVETKKQELPSDPATLPPGRRALRAAAILAFRNGRYDDAIVSALQALGITSPGSRWVSSVSKHPDNIVELMLLSRVFAATKQLQRGEPFVRLLSEIFTPSTDIYPAHVQATLLCSVGEILDLYNLGNIGFEYFKKYLEMSQRMYGPNSLVFGDALTIVSAFHYRRGAHSDAIKAASEALEIRSKNLRPPHARLADSFINRGIITKSLGRYEEAINDLKEGAEQRVKLFGTNSIPVADVFHLLGTCGDRFKEARRYLSASHAVRLKLLGPTHRDTLIVAELLSRLPPVEVEKENRQQLLTQNSVFRGLLSESSENLNEAAGLQFIKHMETGTTPPQRVGTSIEGHHIDETRSPDDFVSSNHINQARSPEEFVSTRHINQEGSSEEFVSSNHINQARSSEEFVSPRHIGETRPPEDFVPIEGLKSNQINQSRQPTSIEGMKSRHIGQSRPSENAVKHSPNLTRVIEEVDIEPSSGEGTISPLPRASPVASMRSIMRESFTTLPLPESPFKEAYRQMGHESFIQGLVRLDDSMISTTDFDILKATTVPKNVPSWIPGAMKAIFVKRLIATETSRGCEGDIISNFFRSLKLSEQDVRIIFHLLNGISSNLRQQASAGGTANTRLALKDFSEFINSRTQNVALMEYFTKLLKERYLEVYEEIILNLNCVEEAVAAKVQFSAYINRIPKLRKIIDSLYSDLSTTSSSEIASRIVGLLPEIDNMKRLINERSRNISQGISIFEDIFKSYNDVDLAVNCFAELYSLLKLNGANPGTTRDNIASPQSMSGGNVNPPPRTSQSVSSRSVPPPPPPRSRFLSGGNVSIALPVEEGSDSLTSRSFVSSDNFNPPPRTSQSLSDGNVNPAPRQRQSMPGSVSPAARPRQSLLLGGNVTIALPIEDSSSENDESSSETEFSK